MRKPARWRRTVRRKSRLRRPGDFVGARGSAIAITMAVALIPLLVAAGGAIDFGRLYLAKSRLLYALDSAALAVGASDLSLTTAQLDQKFDDFVKANYPAGKLGTVSPDPVVPTITNSTITATAMVQVPTVFLKIAGINTLTAHVTSQVKRQTTGLELALVLDNSKSMVDNGLLDPLKTAVGQLLDTVFNGQATPTGIKAAIIPYTGTVNIGTGNSAYVLGNTNQYPDNVDTSWKGCVMARSGGYDVTDDFTAGSGNSGEWTPYFWEAEQYYYDGTNEGSALQQCPNRWWRPLTTPAALPETRTGRAGGQSFYDAGGTNEGAFTDTSSNPLANTSASVSVGPNRGCPTPITPLTNVRATLDAGINAMDGWNAGSTVINSGVVWGWRVLSPGEPFTEGVAYGTADTKKVMVIMTDGFNEIGAISPFCTAGNSRYNSQYSSYGYASEGLLGSGINTRLAMDSELDTRLATLCSNIKAQGPNDITIYTITFGMDNSAQWDGVKSLMQNCASSPSNYFNAPSASDLQTAFTAIGAQLTNLRVAQ